MTAVQDLDEKICPLRELFLSTHAGDLATYDERDLKMVKEDDVFVKCFLTAFYSGEIVMEKAVSNIDQVLKFRKEFGVTDLTIESIPQNLVDDNIMFFKGVDKSGKPLLHYKVARFFRGKQAEEMKLFITYTLEKHYRSHMGERIIVLFDFTGAGVSNMDLNVVRFIIDALSTYFPSILEHILVFEMPWIVSAIWKVIRAWLSEGQKNLITQVSKADIQQYVDASQLEEHMLK